MRSADYLARIGLTDTPTLDLNGLGTLQRAHLTTVPFENLDVYARRGVATTLDWSVPKIVARGRGGWCFELNGAFSSLLRDLGFEVRLLPAAVLLPPASNELSHLTLEVKLDRPYLVDVGFGDSFIKPLRIDLDEPQDGGSGQFVVTSEGTLFEVDDEGELNPQYRFQRSEWELADFNAASARLQTAPGLHWTELPFATRLLDGGPDRVTLLKDRIKFRRDGQWHQEQVATEDWDSELNRWFGMKP
ncbi:MAG: arylamine N-acetyltransferase [Actinomycetota bacterium]|nr:arylamine N-acetyltransferase [Actinomycetota bacterium]